MNVFENNYGGINLMVWETDPRKRSSNNEIQFVASDKITVVNGDMIIGMYGAESGASVWMIADIIETRQSSIKGMINYKAKAEWSKKSINFFDGKTQNCSKTLENSITKFHENQKKEQKDKVK